MKKLSLLIAASALALGAWAIPSFVQFSSVGPDTYADGTTVLDGEVYALVASKTEFMGLKADGSLVDPDNDTIIGMAPLAKDGRCTPVVFTLPEGVGGNLAVYLLDTRVQANAGGQPKVAGLKTDGTPAAVNSYVAVQTAQAGAAAHVAAVSGTGAAPTAVPAEVPQPVVTGIRLVGAKVLITVANTVPYLQYTVTGGATLSNMDQNNLATGINGAEGDITLVVEDSDENRFFKVTRASK